VGEITTNCYVDIPRIVRTTVKEIGYTRAKYGFDGDTCGVMTSIDEQSADIALGVDKALEAKQGEMDEIEAIGAGDQGMMFGYATDETPELMPLPISMAHQLARRLSVVRKTRVLPWLRPDGKTQVTVEYDGDRPVRIDAIVVSTQHRPDIELKEIEKEIFEKVVLPVVPAGFLDAKTKYYINPTGRFVVGGPQGDAGLTGRKIIVDTYGGMARHGGGAGVQVRDPAGVRDRRGPPGVGAGGNVRHGQGGRGADREADRRSFRSPPGRHHQDAGPQAADLPPDGGLRPFRPHGCGPAVGADGQGGNSAPRGEAVSGNRVWGLPDLFGRPLMFFAG